ncbi:hypothetical protein ABZ656_16585 [Streptomyces sp. NPDC007095]|jgi:hypothetical protein|uniref:hypothetical protein n=1 Tax=Streptomyces sp. NPDC007095 TaxID=3154482 RepID=UPI000CA65714
MLLTLTFRMLQLTPPGSARPIQIDVGLADAPPGSARAVHLAVADGVVIDVED